MKKIMTLAAIFAAVMMGISSCNPDDTKPEQKPDTEQPGNETPGEGEGEQTPGEGEGEQTPGEGEGEEEYASPITIDGTFTDWDNLEGVVVCKSAVDAAKQGLKEMRVYADEVYLNVLLEFDPEIVADRTKDNQNPVSLYLSTSKDAGGYNTWSDLCIEYMLQGWCFNGDAYDTWTSGMYMWTGEVHGEGWNWESVLEDVGAESAGAGDKIEIRMMMDLLAGVMEFGDTFLIGADVQQAWDAVGLLPNAAVTDENLSGSAPMLEVAIVK